MGEAKVTISAEDRASSIIDHVSQKLGVFNKQGIAMGLGFAAINKGIDLAMQGFQALVDYIQKGIEMNRQFDLSLARLSVSANNLNLSIGSMKDSIQSFSVVFATDMNTLASGFQNFIREGYSAAEAEKLLYETGKLLTTTNEDLATTQHAVITAMQVFNLSVEDAETIVNKLYQISTNTGLSISQVDTVMGRTALTIQKYGIDIDTAANAYYTLDNTGTDLRGMTTDLNKAFEDLNLTTLDTITNTSNLDTAYKTITDTTYFMSEQMKQVANILQMQRTEQMDIGAFFDTNEWNKAIEIIGKLKEEGITTLDEFNAKLEEAPDIGDIFSQLFSTDLGEGAYYAGMSVKVREVVKAMLYANEVANKVITEDPIKKAARLAKEFDKLQTSITDTTDSITTSKQNISDWLGEIKLAEMIHPLNEDLRYMDMALTDVTYASNIHNKATRNLIISIKTQQDAIDNLNRSNQIYALQESKNSLEIMKIQYAAMGTRRGLTRAQLKQIEDIEKANLGLRINMVENQNIIDQKTLDLDPMQKRLELTKLWYNEEVYTIQNAYNLEIQALKDKIATEETLLKTHYATLETLRTTASSTTPSSTPGASESKFIGPIQSPSLNQLRNLYFDIPKLQTGGSISRTGLAIVHEGETVIPKDNGKNSIINITLNAVINKDIDINTLGKKVAHAISKGLINNNATPIARMR